MKYVAKLETGRLCTRLDFEAESFTIAVERVEIERIGLDERTQLSLGSTYLGMREGK